jgi:low temperature requirement protein LtrA
MRIAVSRTPGAARDVNSLELFFDLVYVFAIGQLSHHLARTSTFGPGRRR